MADIFLAQTDEHFNFLKTWDWHVHADVLKRKMSNGEILVVQVDDQLVGWLRFGYFWDSIPFMNLLYFVETHRGQGLGRQIVTHWERLMAENGHSMVMTSTLSNEQAQFFYRKLGYKDSGSLLLENEALEIIFTKSLTTPAGSGER